jgi:CBS domain containing-hemolysin-like protein
VSTPAAIGLAVLLLVGNAFFVGSEFAMISARRSQIEPLALDGSRLAGIALKAMENITLVIAVNQLGITLCSLLLGAIGEPAVAHLLDPALLALSLPEGASYAIAFALALGLVVFLHVVLGEMVPKNLALAGPERAALLLAPAIWAFVTVLRPVVVVINLAAAGALRLVGVRLREEVSSTYTREEVGALVEQSRGEGLLEDAEYDRLAHALGFTERTVAEVLLDPAELTLVERGSTAADVEAACAHTGFSRFPVSDGDGALVGYLHIKDVLEPDPQRRLRPVDDRWVRPLATVTAATPLHEALEALQRTGAHMARVVDDAGTTIGVATLEDVIEELVGEIRDAAHLDDPAPLERLSPTLGTAS